MRAKALVTRPQEDAAQLAAALAARGLEPLIEPMLAIRFATDGAQRLAPLLEGVQALLFTSANGARAFAAASPRRDLPVYAVGDATAAAARAAGFDSVASAQGNVADLARLACARLDPRNGALLHAAASAVAGDLAGALGGAGFALRRAVLYEAVPAARLGAAAAAALAAGEVAVAVFFSPRTADAFVRLAAAAQLGAACRAVTAIALSPAVAAALAGLAWRSVRVAAAPEMAALLAALDGALAEAAAPLGERQDVSA